MTRLEPRNWGNRAKKKKKLSEGSWKVGLDSVLWDRKVVVPILEELNLF